MIIVAGAGGFIGGHLVRALAERGAGEIRAVDAKPLGAWFQRFPGVEEVCADLRDIGACRSALRGATEVYNFACDMGGMGFIENHKADCMLSVLINTHLLMAAREERVTRYFYASSACVYPADRQRTTSGAPLEESEAYPAMPEDGYGWEKLFGERMCRHFREDFGLETRVARLHNVYGPHGTWEGGREKAPAAICRKVIEAVLTGRRRIEIWGDGRQTRSFTYIDDCVKGVLAITAAGDAEPVNLGSSELVTIDGLVDLVEEIAGIRLERVYDRAAPQGVRGRNSDNRRIQTLLGWEPATPLSTGLEKTYAWIRDQMTAGRQERAAAV